ncbi:OmpA family protein [Roseomonas sp. CCTCC AB2023176]|uniref:OmpA family protein n=1 Tax=Roseomonas sp. CCTCC AB2023176 TaxID=3342640 RepID=UPI0035DEA719
MNLRPLLLASALLLPAAAQAQPVTGLYIAGGFGANWLQPNRLGNAGPLTEELRAAGFPVNGGNAKVQYELGFVGLASIGYGFGNGLRAEIEGNYRQNDVDKVRNIGAAGLNATGRSRSYGAMANVFYDFDFATFGIPVPSYIQPYIGAGVGAIWRDFEDVGANFTGGRIRSTDSDVRFAYQAIAGIGVPLTFAGVPGLTLTAEYRFLGTAERGADTETFAGGFTVRRSGARSSNYNNSVLVGLRYAFNQPRPAVAAPPPAAPAVQQNVARTYLVFFDWDRADLSDRARQIVAEAANAARTAQVTRIEVAGHADRSGTPQYNQRLSQRRAEVVASELVRNGVPRGAISVQAFGESQPLVPTADGVREPQNRRVEIVLR